MFRSTFFQSPGSRLFANPSFGVQKSAVPFQISGLLVKQLTTSSSVSKPSKFIKANRSVKANILARLNDATKGNLNYTEILEELKVAKDLNLTKIVLFKSSFSLDKIKQKDLSLALQCLDIVNAPEDAVRLYRKASELKDGNLIGPSSLTALLKALKHSQQNAKDGIELYKQSLKDYRNFPDLTSNPIVGHAAITLCATLSRSTPKIALEDALHIKKVLNYSRVTLSDSVYTMLIFIAARNANYPLAKQFFDEYTTTYPDQSTSLLLELSLAIAAKRAGMVTKCSELITRAMKEQANMDAYVISTVISTYAKEEEWEVGMDVLDAYFASKGQVDGVLAITIHHFLSAFDERIRTLRQQVHGTNPPSNLTELEAQLETLEAWQDRMVRVEQTVSPCVVRLLLSIQEYSPTQSTDVLTMMRVIDNWSVPLLTRGYFNIALAYLEHSLPTLHTFAHHKYYNKLLKTMAKKLYFNNQWQELLVLVERIRSYYVHPRRWEVMNDIVLTLDTPVLVYGNAISAVAKNQANVSTRIPFLVNALLQQVQTNRLYVDRQGQVLHSPNNETVEIDFQQKVVEDLIAFLLKVPNQHGLSYVLDHVRTLYALDASYKVVGKV